MRLNAYKNNAYKKTSSVFLSLQSTKIVCFYNKIAFLLFNQATSTDLAGKRGIDNGILLPLKVLEGNTLKYCLATCTTIHFCLTEASIIPVRTRGCPYIALKTKIRHSATYL